jgi:hypothetical protein
MGKIKITEDQLKRLVVLKEQNMQNQGFDDFDTQMQPEELPSTQYDGMSDMKNSNDELERMSDSFIKQYKEKAIQGIDEDMVNSLCDKIRQGLVGGGDNNDIQYNDDMPGFEGTMDSLNKLSIRGNESVNEEKYFAKHGDNTLPWVGSSNKTYGDLPDGDYDDETYDDFDTLHGTHPDFHRHYTGGGGAERAKEMFNVYKHKHGPLRMKRIKQMNTKINESVEKIKFEFNRFL